MGHRIREYVRVVLAIFKRDLNRVLHNPVAIVLIVGACALPSAYAWFCTAANWDPYQRTEGIRFSVASNDKGSSTSETGEINIGSQVLDQLKDNHELGWAFYDDSEAAINSVYSGESYAAIVFPEDFSKDFTSMLTGDFKRPQIEYYVNEKLSAAAPNFTNQGVNVVQEEINQSFVKEVSKTVLDITQKVGEEASQKADAAEGSLANGVRLADESLSNASTALSGTAPAIDGMIEGAHDASSALSSVRDSIPGMESTLATARKSLKEARDSSAKYDAALQDALAKGSVDVGGAASQAQTSIAESYADLNEAYGKVSAALAEAQGVVVQNSSIIDALQKLDPGNGQAASAVKGLKAANKQLSSNVDSLASANDALHSTLQGVNGLLSTLSKDAVAGASDVASASSQMRTQVMPAINSSLDSFADVLGSLSGLVIALGPAVDQAQAAIDGLSGALFQAKDSAAQAASSLGGIQSRLDAMYSDITALQDSASVKMLGKYLKINPDDAASFISAPVKLQTTSIYPVKNYGSGIAPFFTSVGLWVAGFVFMGLFKMRVDPEGVPKFTESQAYWARWLMFISLSILPPIIACAGSLVMGVQCVSPPAFFAAGIVTGVVFMNFIYALGHAFRYIGKALAVLFLIMQIPGSSGLYPIEMMPQFFQAIHPFLPFTYSVDAFRESIGGFYGMDYLGDLLILMLVFFPLGLFIGLVLGRWVSNLTLLFDRDIGRTGIFMGERTPKQMRFKLTTLLHALLRTPEYSSSLKARESRFMAAYPRLKLIGWVAIVAQFVIMFTLMVIIQAGPNAKAILLMIAVASILVVDAYLIVIAYMKESMTAEMSLIDMPQEDVAAVASSCVSVPGVSPRNGGDAS